MTPPVGRDGGPVALSRATALCEPSPPDPRPEPPRPLQEIRALVLAERLEELGRALGEREAPHAEGMAQARVKAAELHGRIAEALERFHRAAARAGAPHLRVELAEPRTDDKHLRAVELELRRGKHLAILTVKSRGDLTLVGPFRAGKTEGPCRSFPIGADAEIDAALADFLGRFLEAAASP